MTDTLMVAGSLHPASKSVLNPQLSLFTIPPADLSMASYRIVPIQTYTTGINPVEFQVDPQEDYVDLSRSFFEIELALNLANGNKVVEATRLWPTNNLAHTLFKQINVRLNGTLISPQTETYHYKAYLETLLNYRRQDGETMLKPQGWYSALEFPAGLTANNTNTEGEGHEAFQALSSNQQASVKLMKAEQSNYTDGKRHVLRFTPHIEVFHLNKLLVPGVQIGIQLYFNSPNLFLNGVNVARRLTHENVKVRIYLCQVRLNPSVYRELMTKMSVNRTIVAYPTVRSEIRSFNMQENQQRYECNNLFQGRIPNRVIVGLVLSEAFTGNVARDPFCFQKFGVSSIRQLVRGEEYPYETLEFVQDLRGYYRFLQTTGCLCKHQGNMVRREDWGEGKNCTLFVFDNAANGCLDSPVLNPKQSGELQIVLNFGVPPGENITVILYGEF